MEMHPVQRVHQLPLYGLKFDRNWNKTILEDPDSTEAYAPVSWGAARMISIGEERAFAAEEKLPIFPRRSAASV
jgi:hypothetical protein